MQFLRRAHQARVAGADKLAAQLWQEARQEVSRNSPKRSASLSKKTTRANHSGLVLAETAPSRILPAKPKTREEILSIAAGLPYSEAITLLHSYLKIHPDDLEIRSLSLALGKRNNDQRVVKRHESILEEKSGEWAWWKIALIVLLMLLVIWQARILKSEMTSK